MLLYNLLIHPLIASLYKLPPSMSLQDFTDSIAGVLRDAKKLHAPSSKKTDPAIETLTKTLIPQPKKNVSLRTVRHMIYQHSAIKDHLEKDGKEIVLDHRTRVQILLAKRLSNLRMGPEVREKILANDAYKN